MAKWQRMTLGVLAALAAMALIGVSLTANFKFATSFGTTDFDKGVLGGASIASDIFKSIALTVIWHMISRKHYMGAFSIAVLGIISMTFSLISATGFMSTERYHAFYTAVAAQQATQDFRETVKTETEKSGWLATKKPQSVIDAEIRRLKVEPEWNLTAGCTAAIWRGKREDLCRRYADLGVELEAAKEKSISEYTASQAKKEIREKGRDYGDPLMEMVSNITKLDGKTVLILVIVISVALIELGSSLGLPVAMALLAPEKFHQLTSTITATKPPKEKATVTMIRAPQPSEVAPPMPKVAGVPFNEPAAATPESGGLRSKIKPVAVKQKPRSAVA